MNGLAKKKNRRKKRTLSQQFRYELLGLLFIFIAIFGSGASLISDGLVPRNLTNAFRFLFGIWYFVIPVYLFIIGMYLVLKRQAPPLLTKRHVGIIFIFIGLLLFTHIQTFEQLQIDVKEQAIIKQSWHHFLAYIKGTGVSSQLGGGMIGALLFTVSYHLFSFAGSKIIAVFTIVIGLLFVTNIFIGRLLEKSKQKIKKNWQAYQKKRKQRNKRRAQQSATSANTHTLSSDDQDEPLETWPEADVTVQYSLDEATGQLSIPVEETAESGQVVEETDSVIFPIETQAEDDYELPPLELLDEPVIHSQIKEKSQIKKTVRILEQTFQSFGVQAKITKAHVGPAVTKYEVYPEAGVKVSKILSLQDDIALALAAQDIRIEAPIPGKSAVGIEVPNGEIATVSLREVLQSVHEPQKKLLFALGRDISGNVVVGELNKMPHLLIAGATGSGKSVCINGIITSILMRAKPHEVKMLMIDPKKVELNVYNGIPHLLAPVVTDPKKASVALRKIVAEMEARYELFSETGTRNLEGYNQYIQKQNEASTEKRAHLPYIVVLIDELADLMMVASKDVEDSIMRLAQMARAAGIHLIIATQRPSVDVITGVIKANIPSRIAFSVSSQVDSRTILDVAGAEKLLGRGDMLYIPVGKSKPIRVQGAFLSDEEVERVVTHCKAQQQATYEETLIPDTLPETDEAELDDELYPEAVQFVIDMQSASASMLQRKFRIGYNRAARLIELMEARGVVGPYEGNRPREVLIARTENDQQEA